MENLSLSIINLRSNKENALAVNQVYLNKSPSFQRTYEAWDDKLKTRLIETILLGRAMNPIWTILNSDNGSEEVLDGMHRLSTALSYLNNEFKLNKNYFTSLDGEKYNNKRFNDLDKDDQAKIRNYNFIFNKLDSSYHTDKNKLRDMYEILNRSSKSLNDYEFNKVIHQPFYDIMGEVKNEFIATNFFNKVKDTRGNIESEIIEMLILCYDLPNSWSSISNMTEIWKTQKLGNDIESVNKFIEKEKDIILELLKRLIKYITIFSSNNFYSNDKKIFKTNYIPYLFIISRCGAKIKDISIFNRIHKNLIEKFSNEITVSNIMNKLGCTTRNPKFQQKLINEIDKIIDEELKNIPPRSFQKKIIDDKLKEQKNICLYCNEKILNNDYEGDHIKSWTSGGDTTIENLQILHKRCHKLKHNN
jgi:hypothetical protein